ncbi:unknown protein [Nostoc sp. NIES-3756]|jgi:hypothetical protein|uniref:hypothetical protein n=1 Tax=Nostoc sp. NIES-3756 TaxID=1751286 RepID=UPI000722D13B|nr:hypothetical protein [Nostoc sp. NIES-3756]BAT56509.1 unknown protein [Nostoc sp. NIES-3756]BAY35736.1 hypothetical protein NIES2111_00520 [Nostoc sp. NIES-2111]
MLSNTKNNLFTEVNFEESATVTGGGGGGTYVDFDLNSYLFVIGAGTVFGNPGLTPSELDTAFEVGLGIESIGGDKKYGGGKKSWL